MLRDMYKAAMRGYHADGGDQFSRLVRQILVEEKRDRICSVADALGMSYANFHARVIGRVHFKPDEIRQLIRVLPDPRLCEFLLRDTAFMAAARPRTASHPTGEALHTATHLASEALAIIDEIGDTFAHGDSDRGDAERMRHHLHEAEIAIGSLRASLAVHKGWKLIDMSCDGLGRSSA